MRPLRAASVASVAGVARVVLVGAAGAALVLGAGRVDGSLDLRPSAAESAAATTSADSAAASGGTTVPVNRRALICPGPERLGIKGGSSDTPRQRVHVLAATAPRAAVPQQVRAEGKGALSARLMPGGKAVAAHPSGSLAYSTSVAKAQGVLLVATHQFAPGTSAMQYSVVRSGDQRGLSSVRCGTADADSWLAAGGAQAGRLERVVLVNPGANSVTADLQVLGTKGAVESPNGHGVVVPPLGRTSVLLDSIAGDESAPVLHVTAHGGALLAAIDDAWLDGVVPRGGDSSLATAASSRHQVVSGLSIDGAASLRVAVPGDNQAVVQTRVLTEDGPRRIKHDVTRVPAASSTDIDLSDLPRGAYAVEVTADVPVVAAASVERGRGGNGTSKGLDRKPTDLAWTPSSAPIDRLAGSPLPSKGLPGRHHQLLLSATGKDAQVTVTKVDARGKSHPSTVTVPRDSVKAIGLGRSASVWVSTDAPSVRAAVVTTANAEKGTVVTAIPLASEPLTLTRPPIRRAGD